MIYTQIAKFCHLPSLYFDIFVRRAILHLLFLFGLGCNLVKNTLTYGA